MADQPSVFISYSHADKVVARAIAQGLAKFRAKVWIDEGELRAGDSIIERVATAIADVHFVVAIVSVNSVGSRWCQKELSLATAGGLNREGVKVLPLRLGDVEMPASLADAYYLCVDPEDPAAVVDRLLTDVRSHLSTKPSAVGPTAQASRARSSPPSGVYGSDVESEARRRGISPSEYMRWGSTAEAASGARLRGPASILEGGPITGIVRDGVGRPRNDGTRGSALYAVPFRLSRTPTADWARHLVETWNRPPAFTTMHRPGIARVSGDVVTLDGVTIEEVERYHLRTLKLCVDNVNQAIEDHERQQADAAERERRRLAEHEASTDHVLGRIKFD